MADKHIDMIELSNYMNWLIKEGTTWYTTLEEAVNVLNKFKNSGKNKNLQIIEKWYYSSETGEPITNRPEYTVVGSVKASALLHASRERKNDLQIFRKHDDKHGAKEYKPDDIWEEIDKAYEGRQEAYEKAYLYRIKEVEKAKEQTEKALVNLNQQQEKVVKQQTKQIEKEAKQAEVESKKQVEQIKREKNTIVNAAKKELSELKAATTDAAVSIPVQKQTAATKPIKNNIKPIDWTKKLSSLKITKPQSIGVTFDEKAHQYKAKNSKIESIFPSSNKDDPYQISGSKVKDYLSGEHPAIVAAMKATGRHLDVVKSAEGRAAGYKKYEQEEGSTTLGNNLHRIAELILTEKIKLLPPQNGVFSLDEEVKKYLNSEEGRKDERANPLRGSSKNLRAVIKAVNEQIAPIVYSYYQQYGKMPLSEYKMGAVLPRQDGGHPLKLVGSADMILPELGEIFDFKTTSRISPDQGTQLSSAYNLLYYLSTGQQLSSGKILHMPLKGSNVSGVNNVPLLSLEQALEQFENIGEMADAIASGDAEKIVDAWEALNSKNWIQRTAVESRLQKVYSNKDETGPYKTYINGLLMARTNPDKTTRTWQNKDEFGIPIPGSAAKNLANSVLLLPKSEKGETIYRLFGDKDFESGEHVGEYQFKGELYDAVRQLIIDSNVKGTLSEQEYLEPEGLLKQGSFKYTPLYAEYMELGHAQSQQKSEPPRGPIPKDKDDRYQSEVWEVESDMQEEEWYKLREKRNATEADMEQMAEMAGSRIMRIIDASIRAENYLLRAHKIEGIESEEDIRSYLAKTNPVFYDQYMESKELLPKAFEIAENNPDASNLKDALWGWITDIIAKSSAIPGKSIGEIIDLRDALFSEGGLWHNPRLREIMKAKFNPDSIGYYTKYRDMATGQLLESQKGMGRDYYYSTFVDPDSEEVQEFLSSDAGYSLGNAKQFVKITGDTIKHKEEFGEDYSKNVNEVENVISKEETVKNYLKQELEGLNFTVKGLNFTVKGLNFTAEEIDKILDQILPNLGKINHDIVDKISINQENWNIDDATGLLTEEQKQWMDPSGLKGVRTALALLGLNTRGLSTNSIEDTFIEQLSTSKTEKLSEFEAIEQKAKEAANNTKASVAQITEQIFEIEKQRGTIGKTSKELLEESRRGTDVQEYKKIGYSTKLTSGWDSPFYYNDPRRMFFDSPEQMDKILNGKLTPEDFSRVEVVGENGKKWIDTLLAGISITDRDELNQWIPDLLSKAIMGYKSSDNLIFSELVRQFFAEGKKEGEYNKNGPVADEVRDILLKSNAIDMIDKRLPVFTGSEGRTFIGKNTELWEDLSLISPMVDEEGDVLERERRNIEAAKKRVAKQNIKETKIESAVVQDALEAEKENNKSAELIAQTENSILEEKKQILEDNQQIHKINNNSLKQANGFASPGTVVGSGFIDVHATSNTDYTGNQKVSRVITNDVGKVIAQVMKPIVDTVDWGSGGLSGFISQNKKLSENDFKNLVMSKLSENYDYGYSLKSGALNKRGSEQLHKIMTQAGFSGYDSKSDVIGKIAEHVQNIDKNIDTATNKQGQNNNQNQGGNFGGGGINKFGGFNNTKSPLSKLLSIYKEISDADVQIANVEKNLKKSNISPDYKAEQENLKNALLLKKKQLTADYDYLYKKSGKYLSLDEEDALNNWKNIIDLESSAKSGIKRAEGADRQKKEEEKAEKDFVKLLDEELALRKETENYKLKQSQSTDQKEIDNLQILIDYNEKLADAKHAEADANFNGSNKNDLLLTKNAELDLYKESLRGKGGSGGPQKQSLVDALGYNKQNLTRMITQYFSLWRVLGKVRQEIQKVIQITKQLDQAATNIRIVTGMNRKEVDNAILSYSKLAAELGTTTTALAQSANEWLRQGYSISESMDLITATTQLSKLGMLDMNSATKVLTSTLKGFKMQASEASTIVDKLTKLDMNYAASAGEIGEAMARTSAIASQMGLSLDETAAMVTTIMDVTQQSAEMAGTAVRSILSRYGNVKAGSFVSMMTEGEDLEKINDIEKVLGVLGISIRNSKMEMRDMGEVLDELAKKWNTLSSVEQNAVATAFAGKMCA